MAEVTPLVLVAASLLSIPSRRIRALARGDQDALRDWLSNESATRLAEARRDARETVRHVEAAGARIVTLTDEAFPRGLLDLADPPPFLIVRGSLAAGAAGGAGTAIVGTREASAGGLRYAFDLARAVEGPVVSGLARGIDAAAHRGALAAGTPTIAYVAHGLGATYPPEHVALEDEIVAAGGAVASEYLPGAPANAWALVRRDRLQAAHARAVVLVESEADGGAMKTLAFARALGRARFVRTEAGGGEPRSGGNREALGDGAHPLEDDVAAAAIRLRWRSGAAHEAQAGPSPHGEVIPLWGRRERDDPPERPRA